MGVKHPRSMRPRISKLAPLGKSKWSRYPDSIVITGGWVAPAQTGTVAAGN